ncbi:MAG: hypothetical protein ACK4FM_00050 [Caldimicrobium sp.]
MEEERVKQELANTKKERKVLHIKEKINVEETEELIKELLEEKKEEQSADKEGKTDSLSKYLIILSLLFLIVALVLGILVINYFIKLPKKELQKEAKKERPLKESYNKNRNFEESKEIRKDIMFSSSPKERTYPFKLEFKNFLFPLDEKAFLKLDVFLYFESHENYKRALSAQTFLRELLAQEIGKKNNPAFWRNKEEVIDFEAYLVDLFKKGYPALSPAKIELAWIILRV